MTCLHLVILCLLVGGGTAKQYDVAADGLLMEGGSVTQPTDHIVQAALDFALNQEDRQQAATFKCTGTMMNCTSEDPCGEGSCINTYHSCKWLGAGVFQQCGDSAGAGQCQAESRCYMECRGTHLQGTACNQRVVKTGLDCNNGYVKSGNLGMACTVDLYDSTRCIEKHPCALPAGA
mmetsp:Transcript_40663/g.75670  ORF Transcript_40663/g.75670 Transcript_40663/m.75670 type:complete len:177 (-) Transcript_40663:185-715(-)